MSRDHDDRGRQGADEDTEPEPARTDNPTGDDQAAANAEDEPAG
jgi:hypothetical protein